MLFWTVVFLIFNLLLLTKNPFKNTVIKCGELEIQLAEGKLTKDQYNNQALLSGLLLLFGVGLSIGEVIYFISALTVDVYKYPTIVALAWFVVNILLTKTNKKDLTTEEGRNSYRKQIYKSKTLRGILNNLIYSIYFGYMFWLLVF